MDLLKTVDQVREKINARTCEVSLFLINPHDSEQASLEPSNPPYFASPHLANCDSSLTVLIHLCSKLVVSSKVLKFLTRVL